MPAAIFGTARPSPRVTVQMERAVRWQAVVLKHPRVTEVGDLLMPAVERAYQAMP